MSSHYIIRDDQAPALMVFDINAVSEKNLFSFLEWNPAVVIDELCISFFIHHQIKVDAVITGSITPSEIDMMMGYQKPYKLLDRNSFPANAIKWLRPKGIHSIDLVATFDKKTLEIATLLEREFNVYIYSDHTKYIHLDAGFFKKWASPGRGFRILMSHKECNIQTENLEDLGDHNYKVVNEGQIIIRSDQPVWVGEIF